jgi:hypothetical protein
MVDTKYNTIEKTSKDYPHMIYIGQDPSKNQKEQLAECLARVFLTLKLA